MSNSDSDDEKSLVFFLRKIDRELIYKFEILALEYNFIITKNPIFVWRAIQFSSVIGRMLYDNQSLEAENLGRTMPLPSWCMSYIFETASKIEYLAEGFEIDTYPEKNNIKEKASSEKKGTTTRFMDKLPWALDFRREGSNSFRDYESFKKRAELNDRMREYLMEGMSASKAYEAIATECEMDTRTVRDLISAAQDHEEQRAKLAEEDGQLLALVNRIIKKEKT